MLACDWFFVLQYVWEPNLNASEFVSIAPFYGLLELYQPHSSALKIYTIICDNIMLHLWFEKDSTEINHVFHLKVFITGVCEHERWRGCDGPVSCSGTLQGNVGGWHFSSREQCAAVNVTCDTSSETIINYIHGAKWTFLLLKSI